MSRASRSHLSVDTEGYIAPCGPDPNGLRNSQMPPTHPAAPKSSKEAGVHSFWEREQLQAPQLKRKGAIAFLAQGRVQSHPCHPCPLGSPGRKDGASVEKGEPAPSEGSPCVETPCLTHFLVCSLIITYLGRR